MGGIWSGSTEDRRRLPDRRAGRRRLPPRRRTTIAAARHLRRQGEADLGGGPLALVRAGRLHGARGRRRPDRRPSPSPAGTSRTPAPATRRTSSPASRVNVGRLPDRPELPLAEADRRADPGATCRRPGRPRNVLDDPFAVRANRETVGGELLVTYDPTPGDLDVGLGQRRARGRAAGRQPGLRATATCPPPRTPASASSPNGRTPSPSRARRRPRDLWEVHGRARLAPARRTSRLVAHAYVGTGEPNGERPAAASSASAPTRALAWGSDGARDAPPRSTTGARTTTTGTST